MLLQGAFFMSMFFALRGMATAPVPSMSSGGLFWFTGEKGVTHLLTPLTQCFGSVIVFYESGFRSRFSLFPHPA